MGQQLTIVIGAGASKELNLPTGTELKNSISSDLNFRKIAPFGEIEGGDELIFQAIRAHSHKNNIDIKHIIDAAIRISHSLPQAMSIDNFIDQHRSDKLIEICGKLAIVKSILTKERTSKLTAVNRGQPHPLNSSNYSDTWLTSFWQIISENCTKKEIVSRFKEVSLIVFNYDRCIEHFLYNTLQSFYGFTGNEAANLVNSIRIYHPYGVVGYLPWQDKKSNTIGFGMEAHSDQLLQLAQSIKTFTEGTDPDSSEILNIRKDVSNAKTLVFLGFGFHRLNLDLLAPRMSAGTKYNNHIALKIYATSKGISDSNAIDIKLYMNQLCLFDNITFRSDLTCYSLFHEYAWKLSSKC